jgi:hypothetical protein
VAVRAEEFNQGVFRQFRIGKLDAPQAKCSGTRIAIDAFSTIPTHATVLSSLVIFGKKRMEMI